MAKNINCLIVPTGIGASIGGFAGDANPVAHLLSKVSDYLITHPNVVNGSVLTKIPKNTLVVEGALLDKFFQSEIALRPNVHNKIAVVLDCDVADEQIEITINCINAARNFYGMDIIKDIFYTKQPIACNLSSIGNEVTLLEASQRAIDAGATALALLARIPDPPETDVSQDYIKGQGYDPIGLIEAKISHLVSKTFMIPSAHAPILDPAFKHEGIVAPRVAAEHLGITYLPSVLNCLNHHAGIVDLHKQRLKADDILVEDLSNLVVPYDSCDGIPMHNAAKHNIDLITVKANTTNLKHTAKSLNLEHITLANYLEVTGYLAANTADSSHLDPKLFIESKHLVENH